MKYINTFKTYASYEEKLNGGGVDISLPNISYCEYVKDVHYTPYNLVRFYVGDITGTTPQTVKIYTDSSTSVDVTVSKGNKWYSYILPKDKCLCKIESGTYDGVQQEWSNGIVTKAVVKANINYNFDADNNTYNGIVPWETTEASFKGSDTSKVTSMNFMFGLCMNLTSLDLSSFDTSKVTSMNFMFGLCMNLTSLDLSSFDTSNVTNMVSMFSNCRSLTSLDLSNFNTSNVTNMESMFSSCSNLTSLDVSSFDTSNVTDMTSMFADCNGLTSLYLRNFNTSKVTSMNGMFYGCSNLTSLDLRNFNTSNVGDMGGMFYGCSRLTSLDLSDWVISDATDTSGMFDDCSNLTSIRMASCNQTTINKIKAVKPSSATIVTE